MYLNYHIDDRAVMKMSKCNKMCLHAQTKCARL